MTDRFSHRPLEKKPVLLSFQGLDMDSTFERVEENPNETFIIEEKDLIRCIERGYDIVREPDGGRYIMKRPNQHSI